MRAIASLLDLYYRELLALEEGAHGEQAGEWDGDSKEPHRDIPVAGIPTQRRCDY